jgi:hypothetical protein
VIAQNRGRAEVKANRSASPLDVKPPPPIYSLELLSDMVDAKGAEEEVTLR